MGEAFHRVTAQEIICAACKSRPAVKVYVAMTDGVERQAHVCDDCYALLTQPAAPQRAS